MALTTNDKLAMMEYAEVWQLAIPITSGTFSQADKQQVLWDYPGILWTVGGVIARIKRFLLLGVGK